MWPFFFFVLFSPQKFSSHSEAARKGHGKIEKSVTKMVLQNDVIATRCVNFINIHEHLFKVMKSNFSVTIGEKEKSMPDMIFCQEKKAVNRHVVEIFILSTFKQLFHTKVLNASFLCSRPSLFAHFFF
jgi:hypothetical protein